MTAPVIDDTKYRYEELPLERISPAETNRKVDDVTGLMTSIEEVGLLQPILVRPRQTLDGEQYEIIAGERRWLAFTQLGRDTIPALVGPETDDTKAFLSQLVENLQREDLDPLYEAWGYQQLLDVLECTQHELAARIGVSQATISKKLSLVTLPKAALSALDSQRITFTEAVEIARLAEHPKEIEKLLDDHQKDIDSGWEVLPIKARVEEVLEEVAEQEAFEAELRKLRDAGVTIYPANSKAKFAYLNKSWKSPNVNVSEDKHKSEPCRAVLELNRSYEEVCSDPKRHAEKGDSPLKSKTQAVYSNNGGHTVRKKTDAEKKAAAKKREETRARYEFMTTMVSKPAPDNLWRVLGMRILDSYMSQAEPRIACEILGIAVPKTTGRNSHRRHQDALLKHARKSDEHLVQALHAFTLAEGEANPYRHHKSHAELLKRAGFKGKVPTR